MNIFKKITEVFTVLHDIFTENGVKIRWLRLCSLLAVFQPLVTFFAHLIQTKVLLLNCNCLTLPCQFLIFLVVLSIGAIGSLMFDYDSVTESYPVWKLSFSVIIAPLVFTIGICFLIELYLNIPRITIGFTVFILAFIGLGAILTLTCYWIPRDNENYPTRR